MSDRQRAKVPLFILEARYKQRAARLRREMERGKRDPALVESLMRTLDEERCTLDRIAKRRQDDGRNKDQRG